MIGSLFFKIWNFGDSPVYKKLCTPNIETYKYQHWPHLCRFQEDDVGQSIYMGQSELLLGTSWAKHVGQSEVHVGEYIGNLWNMLRTHYWELWWEHQWQFDKNTLGTTKILKKNSISPQPCPKGKKKTGPPLVHASSSHWPCKFWLPTCVLNHFWPRLKKRA